MRAKCRKDGKFGAEEPVFIFKLSFHLPSSAAGWILGRWTCRGVAKGDKWRAGTAF